MRDEGPGRARGLGGSMHMLQGAARMLAACCLGGSGGGGGGGGGGGAVAAEEIVQDRSDSLLRYRDLGATAAGPFSIAVVQANAALEDESRVESSSAIGTFVGVFDGHGGPDAARFANQHLFEHLQRMAAAGEPVSPDLLRRAFAHTEQGFQAEVTRGPARPSPQLASSGCCALVGVLVPGGTLLVASLGDSRAVLGTSAGQALELSVEHNAAREEVRRELRALHPDDPEVVVMRNGVWRVKGIIQVSRSIGDFYLKLPDFDPEEVPPRFRLPEPLRHPVLSAVPHIHQRTLLPQDRFLVFASDGLWEQLSNEQVVAMVHSNPRAGIARRLVKAAMQTAARKRELRLSDLKKLERGIRRHFHDDITVVVVFLDHDLLTRKASNGAPA